MNEKGGRGIKKYMREAMRNISRQNGDLDPDEGTISCDSDEFRKQLRKRRYKHKGFIVDIGANSTKHQRRKIQKANEKILTMQADYDSGGGFD